MNTNFISSRHVKRENTSLPVDVRRSKTSLLKLPTSQGGAGRKKKKARGARALLDLTWPAFCGTSWQRFVLRSPISPSSVHIGVSIESCCWYFSNGWRKAIRKIKGKTLGASDIFNGQEKRFKKKVIDLVLVKAFRWRIRDKTRWDQVTRNALATQNNEA